MQNDEGGDAQELDMDNLQGVFLVLGYGSVFALMYGCGEALLHIYRQAKSEKVSQTFC